MVDWVITFLISCFFSFFENTKIWVGRTTLNEEKKADGHTALSAPKSLSNFLGMKFALLSYFCCRYRTVTAVILSAVAISFL